LHITVYQHQDSTWVRSRVVDKRDISTVILNNKQKEELLEDVESFLDPESQKWYSNHSLPYRRGYLLYGPPGTGKSSLSFALAGLSRLDIYILSLSAITEASLTSLFAKLPSRCVILLEDVDAVSSNRLEDSPKIATGSSSKESRSVGGKVSLSALLNVIDGVASQEGRILIMTTNHIEHLDEALLRPGRVDKRIELGLADKQMTADLFRFVFKPVKGDENTQLDVDTTSASPENEVNELGLLANEFATRVPELKFTTAEILSFLLEHRQSPTEAMDNTAQFVSKPFEAGLSEDAKLEDAQPQSVRDSKLVCL
ncbi:P-loop containing nucleoside triphosphate hydrolase protein, partial [Halenospora varia]